MCTFDTADDEFDNVNWGDFKDATTSKANGEQQANGSTAQFEVDFDDDTGACECA